jgi:hypothetical protein
MDSAGIEEELCLIGGVDEGPGRIEVALVYVGVGSAPRRPGSPPLDFNDFDVAAGESQEAYRAQRLWSFIRHARIPPERAAEFWTKALVLVHEFDGLPRSGSTAYGFVVGIYPIPDYPVLPDASE